MAASPLFAFLVILCILPCSIAHSWADCTDYRMTNSYDEAVFNRDLCHGYPRCGAIQLEKGFGVDTGMDYHPTPNAQCHCQKSKEDYSVATMAKYTKGQRVCVAYPAKNHVAHTCDNIYVPKGNLQLRRSGANPTSDPYGDNWDKTYAQFTLNGTTNVGFPNCPKFCENEDKALCTTCFQLESDLVEGTYTFQWLWEFNPGQFYSTCWEATVVSGSGTVTGNSPTDYSASTTTASYSESPTAAPYSESPTATPYSESPTAAPYSENTPAPYTTNTPIDYNTVPATTAPTPKVYVAPQTYGSSTTSSICKGFYESCQSDSECTIGSSCSNYNCTPKEIAGYVQCGTPSALDQSKCALGWTCQSVNAGTYAQCQPGPKQCN